MTPPGSYANELFSPLDASATLQVLHLHAKRVDFKQHLCCIFHIAIHTPNGPKAKQAKLSPLLQISMREGGQFLVVICIVS